MPSASAVLKPLLGTLGGLVATYAAFICLLTIPTLQDHVIYLHRVTLTWFQDVNTPEQWGFLRNQVTPFHLKTPDGETLHAWHVLPLEIYRQHQAELRKEPTGLCSESQERLSFKLLKDDPTAQLVIYFHGAAGTLGSGWRPQSYRALSAASPNVHVLVIDYRGFGRSTGWPSETGLLTDALTLTDFALKTVGIPPERTVLFAQSLGTGVAVSLTHHFAKQSPPTLFAGTVLVAPFADIESLTRTYKVAGTVPLLSPVAFFPPLLALLNRFIVPKFPSKEKLAALIHHLDTVKINDRQRKYDITIIHAEDDYDIPWIHSDVLFWHAVNATLEPPSSMPFDQLERVKEKEKTPLGAGGWEMEWKGKGGVIREQIVKHGLHDRIMSYPVVYAIAVHPGAVNTAMQQQWKDAYPGITGKLLSNAMLFAGRDPEQGSYSALWAATADEIEEKNLNGYYFNDPGQPGKETAQASDENLGTALWELSERIVKENLGQDALLNWSAKE